MKKFISIFLIVVFLFSVSGCSKAVVINENELIKKGEITKVTVTSLPDDSNYIHVYTSSYKIKRIINYLNRLTLESEFIENPNDYVGGTLVIQINYKNGTVETVYHCANMFIRLNNGDWKRMKYEEAEQLDKIIDELN